MRKKLICGLLLFAALFLGGCSADTAVWNGETEYYAHISMAVDETNLYEYVGVVDYVFVGTVEKVLSNVIPDDSDSSLSKYQIRVDQNLKGELTEIIECSKHGGLKRDGTMMLVYSDNSRDSGLPEAGKQYIFLAYAQKDGSLTLSEFFDNRPFDENLLQEYLDYCENEVPFERTRFVSSFDRRQEYRITSSKGGQHEIQ